MFLFIFHPSKNWSYCGGCIIIMAHSFEEVVGVFNEWNEKQEDIEDFHFHREDSDHVNAYDHWVLFRQYGLAGLDKVTPEVVCVNYQWA